MRSQAECVTTLIALLEAEERLYLELRNLLQRERELIAGLDVDALETLVMEKESLAEEGRFLEQSRIAIATELSAHLELAPQPVTLSQICAALGGHVVLRDAHSRLAALVGAVQELLQANAGFAGEAQAQVHATLRLLGRLLPDAGTYDPIGSTSPALRPGRLVRQSV